MNVARGVSAPGSEKFTLSIDDLLTAARAGALAPAPQQGPRSRRRASRHGVASSSVMLAALALEGCKTMGGEGPSVTPPVGGGAGSDGGAPAPTPPNSSVYAVQETGVAGIPIGQLLSTQPGAQSIVSIDGAENGVALMQGAVVYFTPADGYSGAASISFTYRDASGRMRSGRFELNVDNEAAAQQGHHSHAEMPSGHDHGGGSSGDGHQGHGGGSSGGGSSGDHGLIHPNDPAKAAEHLAMLDLVPVSQATHVAIKSGSWFDPSTWASGQVPGDNAKVYIPEGIAVAYDGESPASIFTVRVDGALDFAVDRDTFLEVDTLVVTPSGRMTIGTLDNPVHADVQAVISIANNGPINVAWDPMLLSRGVLTHGDFAVHGAEKTGFVRLAIDPMKGDTSLVLDAIPQGWRVGDKLVLAGTHRNEPATPAKGELYDSNFEDEELVITAIVGNTVYLDRPLQYNHDTPRDDLKTYVANYTRNVRIETENADSVPMHERGHVMFMHADTVDVRYAEFFELGRTDKSVRAFDVENLDTVESDSNIKGRYALHIHRAGVSDADSPVMIVGNAVWGSPGWGFVHHDSHAILADNAAYKITGAAYVAELGTETGRWANNISIHTSGVWTTVKEGDDVNSFDLGRDGTAFWFQSRMVDAVGNVAASATGSGYVYMHRSPSDLAKIIDPLNVAQNDKLRYLDKVFVDNPNISKFLDNEAFGTRGGLHVVKANTKQGHDVRSEIENFTAWETRFGIHLEYTSHYTLKNIDLISTDTGTFTGGSSVGIHIGTEMYDLVIVNANIDGYRYGVFTTKESLQNPVVTNFEHHFIDVYIANAKTAAWVGVAANEIQYGLDYANKDLTFDPGWSGILEGLSYLDKLQFEIQGIKTDSLGQTAYSHSFDPAKITFRSLQGAIEQNGYWTTADGTKVTLIEEYVADRITGDLIKVGIFVSFGGLLDPDAPKNNLRVAPEYHGVLNPDNLAPVALDDHVSVRPGQSIVINVLANDFDPEGGMIRLDGLQSGYGMVVDNGDGTVTYFADPSQTQDDVFFYWVVDDQGAFTKAAVHVAVEI